MGKVTSSMKGWATSPTCGLACDFCNQDDEADCELEAALPPVATDTVGTAKVAPDAQPVRLPVVVVDIPQAVARQDAVFGWAPQDY